MVLYNLADTYFVGMLNDPVQNAAVTLAAPVMLAFNAVNNLFGVGSSSMMSRALGRRDYDTVAAARPSASSAPSSADWPSPCSASVFKSPLLSLLGAGCHHPDRHRGLYVLDRHLRRCPGDPQCRHGLYGALRRVRHARQYRHHERLLPQYYPGPHLHHALGSQYGRCGRRAGYLPVQLRRLPLLHGAALCKARTHLCLHRSPQAQL